jgi:hypothetical protein
VPTLTVTDRADGTGADAAVSGFLFADTVSLYAQDINGGTLTQVGTRSGDGAIAASLATGHYLWVAKGGFSGTLSGVVVQPVTDGAEDVQARVIDAVAARIRLLALPGMAAVYTRKVPWDDDLMFPATVVTDFAQVETVLGGTTGHDEYGHPAYVMFRTNDAHDEKAVVAGAEVDAGNVIRNWRGKVTRAFQGQRLPGVAESMWCEVEPAQITVMDPAETELLFSALLIRARTRERRGFGI